jgi:subtilase family serine protease
MMMIAILPLPVRYGAAPLTSGQLVLGNTPGFVSTAKNLGPEDATKSMSVTLWLHVRNQGLLDELAQQLYDRNSPNYRHWLKAADFKAKFAPTDDEVRTVAQFLRAHNLKVSTVGPNNFFVTAQGTVGDVEKAFYVHIDRFSQAGQLRRANTADPYIEGPAGALVAAVSGLSDMTFRPHSVRPVDPSTGKPYAPRPFSAAHPNGKFFEGACFRPPETVSFDTGGGLPMATYTGNRFGSDIDSSLPGTLPPCGYSPAEVRQAYNLNPLYAANESGQGQTIVIVDAFGSPTIAQDANAFTGIYKLRPLNASNFKVINYPAPPTESDPGWAAETTLDVEWAHTIAPRATIDLIVTPSNNFTDLNGAVLFAINYLSALNDLSGNVISNSYGSPESVVDAASLNYTNLIAELGAVAGVSVNYSSGDDGDFTVDGLPPTVSFPADLQFATGLGGVSLGLNANKTPAFQTGWGNNFTVIADVIPNPPVVPPFHEGLFGGSGGGTSRFFSKPAFQQSLKGSKRLVPDISWLADPYTGVEIFQTVPGVGPGISVIGGTSLACPMFSALWAIANQVAGEPLGQAAQYVYTLPAGAVTDVVPFGSPNNVAGKIHQATPPNVIHLTAAQLAAPLGKTKTFYSALYNSPFSTRWFVITFGTDSSLTTAVGWDNVTGVGTPDAKPFVGAFVP